MNDNFLISLPLLTLLLVSFFFWCGNSHFFLSLLFIYLFSLFTYFSLFILESVLHYRNKFSLKKKRLKYVNTDKNNSHSEFVLSGKFLTRRVLNIDINGRMLKPIWKACQGFKICTVGNHVILFVFDIENDVERAVLMKKPWGFDNKGTLIVEKQEYGSWLCTPLFN